MKARKRGQTIHFLVTVHGRARDSISGNGSAVRL